MNENTTNNSSDKVVVHATKDRWEADIFRTALLNADIRCKMQSEKNKLSTLALTLGLAALLSAVFKLPMYIGLSLAFLAVITAFVARRRGSGKKVIELVVSGSDQVAALEVVSRVSLASVESELDNKLDTTTNLVGNESAKTEFSHSNLASDLAVSASTKKELVTKRSGIGEIIHHVDRGFELRVGPQPYQMVAEDRWDEFQNFSAQRQEFAFLLKNEYENLYKWLKEEKEMAEFVRLIESTYREVPPPRPKKQK